jgi:alkaline phosphatase
MTEPFTRRHFLIRGSVVLAGGVLGGAWQPGRLLAAQAVLGRAEAAPALRFGIVTDIHYSDKAAAGSRVYRDSLDKMKAAVAALNRTAKQDTVGLAFAVTLGDMIDSPAAADMTPENIAAELGYLKAIEAEWGKVAVERHYVLGNHCVFTLTKEEFFANTKARPAPYSFDVPGQGGGGALHLVVLDACFVAGGAPYGRRNADWRDTNIPASQVKWLGEDLAKTKNPTVIFAHQRLDGDTANGAGDFQVKNAAEVRTVLEKSGKVLAVLQGHSHQNYLATVNGIPYCVLRAMVEDPGAANNAFASVEIFADRSIAIRGNFRQASYANLATAKSAISPPATGAS